MFAHIVAVGRDSIGCVDYITRAPATHTAEKFPAWHHRALTLASMKNNIEPA